MIGVQTIGNATLVAYDKLPILSTDPWMGGDHSANFGSWRLPYDIPDNIRQDILRSEYIWLSHGHQDHLNPDSLHVLEKKVLVYLRENREVELKKISAEVNLTLDQVRRSIEWLKEKNLIKIDITQKRTISLDKEGIKAVKQGLPERQLIKKLEQLGGKSELRILSHELKLSINEISAALGYAKAAKWINVK